MSTKTKIALAAVLLSAIASPSFAGDQDSAALQVSSGRILGMQHVMPTGSYASVAPVHPAGQQWTDTALNERLAQGHN